MICQTHFECSLKQNGRHENDSEWLEWSHKPFIFIVQRCAPPNSQLCVGISQQIQIIENQRKSSAESARFQVRDSDRQIRFLGSQFFLGWFYFWRADIFLAVQIGCRQRGVQTGWDDRRRALGVVARSVFLRSVTVRFQIRWFWWQIFCMAVLLVLWHLRVEGGMVAGNVIERTVVSYWLPGWVLRGRWLIYSSLA